HVATDAGAFLLHLPGFGAVEAAGADVVERQRRVGDDGQLLVRADALAGLPGVPGVPVASPRAVGGDDDGRDLLHAGGGDKFHLPGLAARYTLADDHLLGDAAHRHRPDHGAGDVQPVHVLPVVVLRAGRD